MLINPLCHVESELPHNAQFDSHTRWFLPLQIGQEKLGQGFSLDYSVDLLELRCEHQFDGSIIYEFCWSKFNPCQIILFLKYWLIKVP